MLICFDTQRVSQFTAFKQTVKPQTYASFSQVNTHTYMCVYAYNRSHHCKYTLIREQFFLARIVSCLWYCFQWFVREFTSIKRNTTNNARTYCLLIIVRCSVLSYSFFFSTFLFAALYPFD